MGWTYTHKSKTQSVKDFFQAQFGENCVIMDCAVVNMRTAYMACYNKSKPSEVFAVICLIRYAPKDPYYNFGYKDMDESMGPCESSCPEKIMKLLTPIELTGTDSKKWAQEWRERCWNNIEQRKAKAKTRKENPLGVGDIVEFENSIRFTDGNETTRFLIERTKPFRVRSISTEGYKGGLYRVGRYNQQNNPMTIVAKAWQRPEGCDTRLL